jgi:hypothetical protein
MRLSAPWDVGGEWDERNRNTSHQPFVSANPCHSEREGHPNSHRRFPMPFAPATARHEEHQHRRFTDEAFSMPFPRPEPKPGQQHPESQRCPFCEQVLPHARTSILGTFVGGVRRLASAVFMILSAILRCIRLAVAGVLCLIGLIGSCSRSIGLGIAHPHDRRFFTRRQVPAMPPRRDAR